MLDKIQKDIQLIFGRKTILDSFKYGDEQEVIFININKVNYSYNSEETKNIIVYGTLEYCFLNTKADYSFLQDRWHLFLLNRYKNDKPQLFGKFFLDKDSTNINYTSRGQYYTKVAVSFHYFIREDFNKVRDYFNDLKITITEI